MLWLAALGCGDPPVVVPDEACDPTAWPDDPGATGYEWCHPPDDPRGGVFVRVAAERVPDIAPLRSCLESDCSACADGETCAWSGYGCSCATLCTTDADCPDDQACLGPATARDGRWSAAVTPDNRCWPATCRTADDCGGADCVIVYGPCGYVTTACRSDADQCRFDADCDDRGLCSLGTGNGWLVHPFVCTQQGVSCN